MNRQEVLHLIDTAAAEGWKELDLTGLELDELPREIGKCQQLETLLLGKWDEKKEQWVSNDLTELPDALFQLTNLKRLDLSLNKIREIPEEIGALSHLTELNFSYNKIEKIPEALARLSNLNKLDLWSNRITEIPNLTKVDL